MAMVVSGNASIHTYLSWHCLIQEDRLLFPLLDYSTVRVYATTAITLGWVETG